MIAPDRHHRMRLVAASAPPGLEPSALPSVETIPNNHRMYACNGSCSPRSRSSFTSSRFAIGEGWSDGELQTLVAEPWDDWGLIDCGNGRSSSATGGHVARPEPQAMWAPALDRLGSRTRPSCQAPTKKAAAAGSAIARCRERWELARGAVRFNASLTPFRHLGFFPDMAPQWDWMRNALQMATMLNLFGYTGVGTLLLSDAGARMVHVDASKKSVEQGKENAALSGLANGRSAGWSTMRQVHGPRGQARAAATTASCSTRRSSDAARNGEVWRLEEHLAALCSADCRKLLDENSRFLVLTVYAVRMSALAIGELVKQTFGRSRRDGRNRRDGGERGGARAASADGDLRPLV
jgi:23S rRNA (cytosine1962-C5)-methyltransferase